jgi:hypothetical protein
LAPFWLVLGSMFMFRIIVYLYDLRHEQRRPPLPLTVAYFFPLPNLCFSLFPVIDFKTFRQTYYDEEAYTIYQTGVAWVVRGLTHLLAYRVVKYYWLPAPHELHDMAHVLQFLAANYALYLRISGWFHVVTGLLHLFGFNLPRTHHNYFLASSISDVWRRINIYWKDFLAKVFFYPTFFALRGRGTRLALALATLGTFAGTWLLHSYQVYWLRGELPVSGKDAVLWLAAGLAVVVGLQLDLLRAGKGAAPPAEGGASLRREALAGAGLALRVAGTFLLVSLFWACWTFPSFPSYLYVRATSGAIAGTGALTLLACAAACAAVGIVVGLARPWLGRPPHPTLSPSGGEGRVRGARWAAPSFARSAAVQAAALAVLLVAGLPAVGAALGGRYGAVMATLRQDLVTPVEAAMAVRGYYEEIADTPVQASPLLPGTAPRGDERAFAVYADMTRPADAFLERELIPGWHGEVGGRRLSINSLGMRDREGISRQKPPGACRLAFVGSSVVMGYGVGDDETFTRLLDDGLNAGQAGGARRFEVLNFGTGRSHAIHRHVLIERRVLGFDPDGVYYIAHQDEFLGAAQHLARLVAGRNKLPSYLAEVAREAGVSAQTSPGEAEARLQPVAPQIVRGAYAAIVKDCRKRGALPVWVYAPMPGVVDVTIRTSDLIDLAEEAGFVVINLAEWADGYAPEELKVDKYHASTLGHRVLADRLRAALRARPDVLPPCAREPHTK